MSYFHVCAFFCSLVICLLNARSHLPCCLTVTETALVDDTKAYEDSLLGHLSAVEETLPRLQREAHALKLELERAKAKEREAAAAAALSPRRPTLRTQNSLIADVATIIAALPV